MLVTSEAAIFGRVLQPEEATLNIAARAVLAFDGTWARDEPLVEPGREINHGRHRAARDESNTG
jgi:hypothetical protein